MFRAASHGGIGAIILIGCLLYFTSAGSWLWVKVKNLDDGCYSVLTELGASIANPVCGALATGVEAMDHASQIVEETVAAWRQRFSGAGRLGSLDAFVRSVGGQIDGLASSQAQLSQMMSRGPTFSGAGSVSQQLQQAIDSFAIGQMYLKEGGQASQALPWLQQGAAQPQGFGLMSQLALGNLYAQGGQGVPPSNQAAQAYLQQAQQSLAILSSSNSPQAQQLLQTLPASPQAVQKQIEEAIRQITTLKK